MPFPTSLIIKADCLSSFIEGGDSCMNIRFLPQHFIVAQARQSMIIEHLSYKNILYIANIVRILRGRFSFAMVIITKGTIYGFARKHPSATIPLNDWFEKATKASWKNFTEVKTTFNTVDAIGEDRYVFNIAGNNFRLVAMIHFTIRTLYIRAILTHNEYDTLSKAKKLTDL